MKNSSVIQQWRGRLDENNTVYQTELYAIHKAFECIRIQTDTVLHLIKSKSLSSLQALKSQRIKYSLVLSIKESLITLENCTRVCRASTGKSIFGNKLADTLAKEVPKTTKQIITFHFHLVT